jgi:hypothetical protein
VEKTYWFKVYLWWNRRAVVEDSNKLEREETRGLTPLTFHPKQKKKKKRERKSRVYCIGAIKTDIPKSGKGD